MSRRNRAKKQKHLFSDLISSVKQGRQASEPRVWHQLPPFHRRALLILVPLVVILSILPSGKEEATEVPNEAPEGQRKEVAVDTTDLSQVASNKPVTVTEQWKEYQVQSGDTLSKVFRNNNLPITDLNALIKIEGLDKPLSKIKQGQLVRFKTTPEGNVDILQLEKSGVAVMFFRLSDGSYGRSK